MNFSQNCENYEIQPVWLPIFTSLMIVLLTLMVFLITFTEKDSGKIKIFKKYLRENLMIVDKKTGMNLDERGNELNPIKVILNRMKSEGVSKKLMEQYITLTQIKKINILDGEDGVCVILPQQVVFDEESVEIKPSANPFLEDILPLVMDLPYIVEIKGYCPSASREDFLESLEFSSKRAFAVYSYFIDQGVVPQKLVLSGFGNAFTDSHNGKDKVEIVFKEIDY